MKLHKQSSKPAEVLFLLALVHIHLVLSRKPVESFPSCVEIVSIDPPPYSVVNVNKDSGIWFEITFSKPVFLSDKGEERVFISTSAAGIKSGTKGIRSRERTAEVIQRVSTSRLQWAVKFTIIKPFYNYFGKIYKYTHMLIIIQTHLHMLLTHTHTHTHTHTERSIWSLMVAFSTLTKPSIVNFSIRSLFPSQSMESTILTIRRRFTEATSQLNLFLLRRTAIPCL